MAEQECELYLWVRDGEATDPCPTCGKLFVDPGNYPLSTRARLQHAKVKHAIDLLEEEWLERTGHA